MFKRVLVRFIILLVMPLMVGIAQAQTAVSPDYILNVAVGIEPRDKVARYGFNLAALEALPKSKVTTTTIWTDGIQEFEGVLVLDFLTHIGVSGGTLEAYAANEYFIEIPLSQVTFEGALIAYKRNGDYMTLRDKGPLWIVFPYDADEKYRTDEVFAQSIWQVDSFIVK